MNEFVTKKCLFTKVNQFIDVVWKPKTVVTCNNCEEETCVDETTQMYLINNKLLCNKCVQQKYLKDIYVDEEDDIVFCDVCCKEIDDIEAYVINKQTMCKQCFNDEYLEYVC